MVLGRLESFVLESGFGKAESLLISPTVLRI
jgi:hypothetical protein